MKKRDFVNGKISLAEGEGSGKHHMLLEKEDVEIYVEDEDIQKVIIGNNSTTITHPEHATIITPKDDEISVFIHEEYDPENEYRKVRD